MSIYKTAVTRPITTIMIFVAIMVLGLYSLVNLPIDFYPEMDLPAISVYTTYPGASAEDVENNVTKNIEKGMNSVDDLKEISSVSKDNYSIVTLEFEWGADLAEAANDIRDNLSMISSSLPDDANEPLIFKFNSSSMPVMFFAVTAKESYPGLVKLIEDKVVNPLQRIEGIASVSITGHPGRAIYVDTDPSKLEAYNITLEQLGNAIAAQNIDLPLGSLEMGQFNFPLRVAGKFTESSQIADIAIGNNNGKTIFLKDVAVVKDTIRDVKLYNRVNGEIGANFFIQKQSGANTVKLSQEVHKKIAEIKKDLPEDVKIELTSDNSTFIQDSIDNLKETVFYAMLFVVVVVFLFLGRWRSTFIIALTIPISLVVAFIYLRITGGTLNIISLMSISIALGMVVDDAIVVLENITTHIERGNRPREAAIYATNEVWLSVIVTTLTVVAIFLPLTFTSGMMGVMF
ncbi:MAG: efflux RND transporter permease subunit, partial [Bacteroidales bacterium]|nr:efflux RND transporter permease subunit [Bacteroidales bacterium]